MFTASLMIVRVLAVLYFRVVVAFDSALDQNSRAEIVSISVAGTRHPEATVGHTRFYWNSCFWTLLFALQHGAKLCEDESRAGATVIFAALTDVLCSSFTLDSSWQTLPQFVDTSKHCPWLQRRPMNTSSFYGQGPVHSHIGPFPAMCYC